MEKKELTLMEGIEKAARNVFRRYRATAHWKIACAEDLISEMVLWALRNKMNLEGKIDDGVRCFLYTKARFILTDKHREKEREGKAREPEIKDHEKIISGKIGKPTPLRMVEAIYELARSWPDEKERRALVLYVETTKSKTQIARICHMHLRSLDKAIWAFVDKAKDMACWYV